MNEILGVICILVVLSIFTAIVIYFALYKNNSKVYLSKYILNKFESDNTSPKLTEMIEFHRNNERLSKYNIKEGSEV